MIDRTDQMYGLAPKSSHELDRWPRLLTNIPRGELFSEWTGEYTVSELECFDQCPERHYFEHELVVPHGLDLRMEPWTAESLPASMKGAAIHELLAGLWTSAGVDLAHQAKNALQRQTGQFDSQEKKASDVTETVSDLNEAVEEIVEHVQQFRRSQLFRRISTSSEVMAEAPITYQMRPGIRLVGAADLLYREADGWRIVDFKMSSGPEAEETAAAHELQCALYSSAVQSAFWPERVRDATVFFTDTGLSHSWDFNLNRLAWWENNVEKIVARMESPRTWDQPLNWARRRCEGCPFTGLCAPSGQPTR